MSGACTDYNLHKIKVGQNWIIDLVLFAVKNNINITVSTKEINQK